MTAAILATAFLFAPEYRVAFAEDVAHAQKKPNIVFILADDK